MIGGNAFLFTLHTVESIFSLIFFIDSSCNKVPRTRCFIVSVEIRWKYCSGRKIVSYRIVSTTRRITCRQWWTIEQRSWYKKISVHARLSEIAHFSSSNYTAYVAVLRSKNVKSKGNQNQCTFSSSNLSNNLSFGKARSSSFIQTERKLSLLNANVKLNDAVARKHWSVIRCAEWKRIEIRSDVTDRSIE